MVEENPEENFWVAKTQIMEMKNQWESNEDIQIPCKLLKRRV